MSRNELKLKEGVETRLRRAAPKQLRRSAKTMQHHADEAAAWWPALSASFAADAARLLARAEELERACTSANPTMTPADPPSAGTAIET